MTTTDPTIVEIVQCSSDGNAEELEALLDNAARAGTPSPDATIGRRDYQSSLGYGNSALFLAAAGGRAECVGVLLKAGATPDLAVSNSGFKRTPLMGACLGAHLECAQLLLAAGATASKRTLDYALRSVGSSEDDSADALALIKLLREATGLPAPLPSELHELSEEANTRNANERSQWLWGEEGVTSASSGVGLLAPTEKKAKGLKKMAQAVGHLLGKAGSRKVPHDDDGATAAGERDDTVIHPVVRLLLIGTRDERSSLRLLRGLEDSVLREIVDTVKESWESSIVREGVYASRVGRVGFPAPRCRCVNMMPVTIGDVDSIPKTLRDYVPLLAACPVGRAEWGKVGYLTIDERTVEADGESQRRGGVHTESPGFLAPAYRHVQDHAPLTIAWGRGTIDTNAETVVYNGGIYVASTVDRSCRVWNVAVDPTASRELGDVEHLRGSLGKGAELGAGELVWITDRTPHESLPLEAGTPRQFFRLVTSDVSVWFADHSTANPLGIKPGESVRIIHGDKFKPGEASGVAAE